MDKNAIKKYAIWAREELIKRVSVKAAQYGITREEVISESADTINGELLSVEEKKQRKELIGQIKDKGYEHVIEEVAYTWFNRFIALRFMEVNNYLPTRIRVFTDEENNFKPQIMAEAIHMELDGLDKAKVLELKEADASDELYKYLLITQCNALSSVLPQMFPSISDYTELLFPDNMLRDGSIIQQMIALISEEDWMDAVQIIGWLYQYYNSVPKDTVFANLKKNIKIKKEDIPAATQLFTPDWIVRYMVENSLGRLWYEGHPNDELKSNWKYYLDEAKQEAEVQKQLEEIREEYKALKPEDIKCIDPCMGSGHILVYMFDVLMQIYESYGYSAREAAASIVENNIYGLDIDTRAAQLSYFAIMMKARQYDARFLTRGIQPNVYAIDESNGITSAPMHDMGLNLTEEEYSIAVKQAMKLVEELHDAREYGSILNITECDWELLRRFAVPRYEDGQMQLDVHGEQEVSRRLQKLINIAEVMSGKYDVVVTNPPYRELVGCDNKLIDFCCEKFPDSKTDLYSVFIDYCPKMGKENANIALVTPQSWMSLASFKRLRLKLITEKTMMNTLMLTHETFESGLQSVAFIYSNKKVERYNSAFIEQKNEEFSKKPYNRCTTEKFEINQDNFLITEGFHFMYDASNKMMEILKYEKKISDYAIAKPGMQTSDNERFLRRWYEVKQDKIGYDLSHQDAIASSYRWFPYNKGNGYKKWYGNNELIVNYYNDGEELKHWLVNNPKDPSTKSWSRNLRNYQYYFREGITFTAIGQQFSARINGTGFLFDTKGPMIFGQPQSYICGFTNSCVFAKYNKAFCKQATKSFDSVNKVPLIINNKDKVEYLVEKNVNLAILEWDSFETSWKFKEHPLLTLKEGSGYGKDINLWNYTIESAYKNWELICNERFTKLKDNEEELNRIFIDIYGLQEELSPEVEDKDITVRKADLTRDIKSFISYAVGCMFGRYSIDTEGLVYAGGEWDGSKYTTYLADPDNIIQISDDEDATDDIVSKFIDFVERVYGKDTIDENLKFIADALGGKGQPKEVIRNYFLNGFFADHCKIYQKRPIYWMFESGKKGGFKGLIYMHRYQADTIARIRTDYIHKQQARYRSEIETIEQQINSETSVNKVKLTKKLNLLREQLLEITAYEEKIHHLADQMIEIDLDDGVKHNYDIFKDVLAKIK